MNGDEKVLLGQISESNRGIQNALDRLGNIEESQNTILVRIDTKMDNLHHEVCQTQTNYEKGAVILLVALLVFIGISSGFSTADIRSIFSFLPFA